MIKAIGEFLMTEDLGWINMSGASFALIAFLLFACVAGEAISHIRGKGSWLF